MNYITSTNKPKTDCVFCDCLKADHACDRDNYIVHRGEHTLTIMNIYPYNPGHLMVLPLEHVATLTRISSTARCEMMDMVTYFTELLSKLMNPNGFNLGINLGKAAGAGIDSHLHFHVVPRWNGDSNFMSVTGNTRVLPEELDTTYSKIVAAMS
jgi:ATP adenylyltransferase